MTKFEVQIKCCVQMFPKYFETWKFDQSSLFGRYFLYKRMFTIYMSAGEGSMSVVCQFSIEYYVFDKDMYYYNFIQLVKGYCSQVLQLYTIKI